MTRWVKLGAALAAVVACAVGGWVWLKDSSLVAVRDVSVTGITSSDGDKVRAALDQAAREMTTLNLRQQVLRDAVAQFPSVGDVEATADFPHAVSIKVIERRPVAALARTGERRVPVTAQGVVLRGVTPERDLPSVYVDHAPAGPTVTDRETLKALKVAGAAPDPLRARANEFLYDERGVVVELDDGPELIFGTANEADQKWVAAARVLAESTAQGATYLDLRIPGRVAAGGLAPVATPTPSPNPQVEAQNGQTLDPQ
jgi:cell division protein FtsQ